MSQSNGYKEPSLQDIFNLINERHNKADEAMKQTIDVLKTDKTSIKRETETNTVKLTELEKSVEVLKQDKLKNIIKIPGLPSIKFDTATFVYNLFNHLDIELLDDEFKAYQTRTSNFIIIQFDSYKEKALLLKKIKNKQSLLTEELFKGIKSNNQIYISDQLTPYFAKIFHIARNAKKEEKIYATTARGGKIRVKKNIDSPFHFIFTEDELNQIIAMNNLTNNQSSTSASHNTNNNYPNANDKRPKRKADNTPEKTKKDKLKKVSLKQ